MASFANRGVIAGRDIKIVTGTQTQTINVLATDKRAVHEASYRLPLHMAVDSADDLPAVATLSEFYAWLEQRGGELQTPSGRGARLAKPVEQHEADPAWLERAVVATERAITRLVEEFIAHPLLHRVESSLHCRLYEFLLQERVLQGDFELRGAGRRTQVVHKEWPETNSDDGAPRGLFDIAILAPQQIAKADDRQFRQGRINAPIVIEIALDYGFHHLDQDHRKVLQSRVTAPYLLHLSRIRSIDEQATIDLIQAPTTPVKTAYVHHAPRGRPSWKHLNESLVHE